MKKILSTLAVVAFLLAIPAHAQEKPKQSKKAKTEKSFTSEEKKACATEKKAGCCSAKKA